MKLKMKLIASLKIWVVIYPSITIFYYLFGAHLTALPLYQRTFIMTVSLVPWMMFAGVPLVDLFIKTILKKDSQLVKK